jgi:hypothetical protein
MALGSMAEREYRPFGLTCFRVGEAERHIPRRAWIERAEHFELREPFVRTSEVLVQGRQFFPGLEHGGREGDGALQRHEGLARSLCVAATEAEQIVRRGEPIVERERLLQSLDTVGAPAPVAGEGKLVENAGRAVVEPYISFIVLNRWRETVARVVDVPEQLARARRGRVEVSGLPQVAERRLELLSSSIRVTALEVADHRVAAQRNRAAERFDRGREVPLGHGGIASLDELPVARFPAGYDISVTNCQTDQEQKRGGSGPFHTWIVALTDIMEPLREAGF